MKKCIKFLFGHGWNDPINITAGGRGTLILMWCFLFVIVLAIAGITYLLYQDQRVATMKVIIAGSRGISDVGYIKEAVEASGFEVTEVVSGTAAGVDRLGECYAMDEGLDLSRFPADWKNVSAPGAVIKMGHYGQYNAIAGHQRNKQMGDYADALIAVWDGKSKGTLNMIKYMQSLGKQVSVYNINTI